MKNIIYPSTIYLQQQCPKKWRRVRFIQLIFKPQQQPAGYDYILFRMSRMTSVFVSAVLVSSRYVYSSAILDFESDTHIAGESGGFEDCFFVDAVAYSSSGGYDSDLRPSEVGSVRE